MNFFLAFGAVYFTIRIIVGILDDDFRIDNFIALIAFAGAHIYG